MIFTLKTKKGGEQNILLNLINMVLLELEQKSYRSQWIISIP